MTQSSIGMIFNQRVANNTQRSNPRGVEKSDDSFMDMLNEKIKERNRSDSISSRQSKSTEKVLLEKPSDNSESSSVKDNDQIRRPYAKNEIKSKPQTEAKEAAQEDNKDEEKSLKESISSVESVIALIEQFIARLDEMNAGTEASDSETDSSQLTSMVAKTEGEASPIELLKALVEGNTEKLNALLEKANEGQQSKEFTSLMENLQKIFESASGNEEVQNQLGLDVEMLGKDASVEDVISQLKAQCCALKEKLESQVSELKNSLAEITAADEVKAGDEIAVTPQSDEESKAELSEKDAKPKQNDGIREKHTHAPVKPHEAIDEKAVAENKNIEGFIAPAEHKAETVIAKADKAQLPLTGKPLAQTVTNQVMMKVKLMTGENKQEMEMHLKPESLGKLSLKIVHERGEILAKISAENEQVKSILESNMQLLKDALEKSGLSVQSLSVSVGNGKDKNQGSSASQHEPRTGSKGVAGLKETSGQTQAMNIRSSLAREFYDQGSQINMTA